MKKILLTGIFLACFFISAKNAFASKLLDGAGGLDQTFSTGYTTRAFAEDLHYQQVYGTELLKKKAGGWIITKTFTPSVTYDTNITSVRQDTKDDVIYGYNGTVAASRQFKKIFVNAFYTVNGTQNVEAEESNVVNHSLGQEIRYNGNRVSVTFTNSLQPGVAFDTSERTELSVDGKAKVVTWADNANLVLTHRISPKTSTDYKLNYSIFYFPVSQTSEEVNGFSTYTITTGPRLNYQLLPKTKIYTDYSFARVYYFEGGEFSSRSDTLSVGAETKITPKMGASGSIGYLMRTYDRNILGYNAVTLNAALNRKLAEKLFGSVAYSRSTSEDFDALEGQNRTQVTEGYIANMSWKMSPRMSLSLGGSIIINTKEGFITLEDPDNDFLTFTREQEDIIYEWNVSYSWTPAPYVSFALGYRFLNQNSSFVDFEHDGQRFFASANCRF